MDIFVIMWKSKCEIIDTRISDSVVLCPHVLFIVQLCGNHYKICSELAKQGNMLSNALRAVFSQH